MLKINFTTCFIIFSLFLNSQFIYSQNSQTKEVEPSWIFLKRAQNYISQRDYANALTMARKAKQVRIEEKLDLYYNEIYPKFRDKTKYEIKKMVSQKREELIESDEYPDYHEVIADIYYYTGFLSESIKEYKITLDQKRDFEYPQKIVEVKYKLANVYEKIFDYELADIIYREIVESFFKSKKQDYWDRVKTNIKDDPTLEKVMRIYRIDGIEYLKALYKIGKRSAIIGRNKEALFYLSVATVVWMTFHGQQLKIDRMDFQYSNLLDFLNFINKREFKEYINSREYLIDDILFFIGYISILEKEEGVAQHYFNLSQIFSRGTKKEEIIKNRIEYLKLDKEHRFSYDELID